MIKAVIFDLGGVLFKGSVKDFGKKAEKLGFEMKKGSETCLDKKLMLGTSSLRQAFERLFERKFFDHEFIPLAKAYMGNWVLDEALLDYAKALGKRYELGILSNSEKSYEEKYDEVWREVFPVILYSHRERMLKPDLEFFRLALKKLGVKPEEAVLIDDARENERPCRQLGIHFVHYKNLEKLKKDLELYGVRA
jgi:HAD superfamily hydrolase (TIGR01509 family)